MTEDELREQIHKRFTLNWLIQGASEHAGMTFHHLVRDELNALEPKLLRLYDQFALLGVLQYWKRDSILILGWPPRFWRQAASKRSHPFFGHSLLSKHGGMLAQAARERALDRSKEKGLARFPMAFSFQTLRCITGMRRLEAPYRPQLIQIAQKAASTVWGIPLGRLHGELPHRVVVGETIPIRTFRGSLLRLCTMGVSRVVKRGDDLVVTAKGTNWLLLAKELVKGTAELICLHGLNQLSDESYRRVIAETDWLELEPWLLQSGGELWRRLLPAVPDGCSVARMLMQLARLPARDLESLIADVIERSESARDRFLELNRDSNIRA